MQQLTTDTLLHGGTYKIVKLLGQGSFGITYLAEHTSLGKKVAIKEFFMKELNSRSDDGSITGLSDGSLSYNYAQKFRKEAQNLARLEHPNIVRVTDCFDENGTFYYVMDYIDGENLNDYIKKTYVDKEEAVNIIKDVAKALLYMHNEMHMLHLDLKPGNIMRRKGDGHIFLIDFGLSKHYSNDGQPETSTTIGLGTAGYAPIEQSNQAKNGEFRPTIDIYALGATLFKLLTRETPPVASELISDEELIEDKLRANGVTGNIVDIIVKAMMPNVRKRTQTVEAFLAELCGTEGDGVMATSKPAQDAQEQSPAKCQEDNEETCVLQAVDKTEEITIESPIAQEPIPSGECNDSEGFTKFFTKYSTAIMIIAGLFFIYDIICYSMEYAPHGDNLHTYFGYGVLHNIIELSLIYTVGVKLLSCNKWYLAIATLGIVLWLGNWSIGWNANYVWFIMGGTLTDGMAEFSQFVSDCSQYGGLLLIIAFLIGVILAKQAINKVVFVLLMIYAGTQFIPHYLNPEDINGQVLSITEYAILLLAVALYFYSDKNKNTIANAEE